MAKPSANEDRPTELIGVCVSPREKRLIQELANATGTSASKIGRLAIQRLLAIQCSEDSADEAP